MGFKGAFVLFMYKRLVILLIPLFISLSIITIAQTKEYDIKSVLIGKISQYLEWPDQSEMDNNSEPFIIAILGENPFVNVFEDVYKSGEQKIKNKNVEIRYFTEIDQIENCHILFISSTEKNKLVEILSYIKGKSVLTVGDTKNFGDNGVHINFYIHKNKIRFELNESSITDEGFNVDYRLRKSAKIVGYRKGGMQ